LRNNRQKLRLGIAVAGVMTAVALTPGVASAGCGGGGLSSAETDICTPTEKARLLENGMLIPPQSAPARVKAVIRAANRIRSKPYIFGGGHARWWDAGYDCSGSVSYALHGGEFIESPLPSGPMARWGLAGEGRWITVYTNPGHAYAVIAGVRWDTSGNTDGRTGPSWHEDLRTPAGFVARHPAGF
jgi:cell wall-associated NlpC family hydrolase